MNPAKHRAELLAAIEQAYRVFERYSEPESMPGWPEEVVEAEFRAMTATTLRILGDRQLYPLAGYGGWGTVDDYRHFLPRILELSTQFPSWGVRPFVTLAELRWQDWPDDEAWAIQGFLNAWWNTVFAADGGDLDGCFEAIAAARDDLSAELRAWDMDTSPRATVLLADWMGRRVGPKKRTRSLSKRPRAQVLAWLLRPETRARLESALALTAPGTREHDSIWAACAWLDAVA